MFIILVRWVDLECCNLDRYVAACTTEELGAGWVNRNSVPFPGTKQQFSTLFGVGAHFPNEFHNGLVHWENHTTKARVLNDVQESKLHVMDPLKRAGAQSQLVTLCKSYWHCLWSSGGDGDNKAIASLGEEDDTPIGTIRSGSTASSMYSDGACWYWLDESGC